WASVSRAKGTCSAGRPWFTGSRGQNGRAGVLRANMTLARRFLGLVALMFWQGGVTLYAPGVGAVGRSEFGDSLQGMVTRRVTDYLNLSGAVALALLAWDVLAAADPSVRRRVGRWLCWAGMAATLAALVWLHPRLEELLDAEKYDRLAFR